MTRKDREQVLEWLSEIVKFPEDFQSEFYSDSEMQILANNALLMISESEGKVTHG